MLTGPHPIIPPVGQVSPLALVDAMDDWCPAFRRRSQLIAHYLPLIGGVENYSTLLTQPSCETFDVEIIYVCRYLGHLG